ncbi:MAG TPA: ATP-dependent DNA helicase RecG [Spirochaetaceae bacterium]|nr:ATP-dependent DNA helicase RecG [Spirochaetaceae bacterium]
MFLRELTQDVRILRGTGPATLRALANLGIRTVADLLLHLPRDYEDKTKPVPISRFSEGKVYTTARVVRHEWFGFGRMRTLKIIVADASGEASLLCFNRPFLEQMAPVGSSVQVYGKFQFKYGEIQSSAFEITHVEGAPRPESTLSPVYSLSERLNQRTLRKMIGLAISKFAQHIEDELPLSLRSARGMPPKSEAIRAIHFPSSWEEVTSAHDMLAYEELFYFQLGIALRIRSRRAKAIERKASPGVLARRLRERLPYALTNDQEAVLKEIVDDMHRPYPMARLLQGDVGSGKTIVAILAALYAVERGGQVAIMAPTELLARQHATIAAHLVEPLGVRLAFVTGSVSSAARPPLLSALQNGEIDIAIGTHALFSEDVSFKNLELVIIDEQQRFGVLQRIALYKKGHIPDLLMMTATPIPRSLALTFFGDLQVSTILHLPPGRKPVVTHLAHEDRRHSVYEFTRGKLKEGRQAYFVYPVISGSERLDLRDAESMASHLANEVFPEFSVGLLHSRLSDEAKMEVMTKFAAGEISILVATTVVEVGVDVPNATVMVIEHAERFGLSALHQLRGRIGRSSHQGYCFLVYSKELTEEGRLRLKALYETTDGFAIAEEDLKIRGPGDMLGIEQSGDLRLTIADMRTDFELLKQARRDAFAVIESDPSLSEPDHQVIRQVLTRANPFSEK